jgi:hypothetical protein
MKRFVIPALAALSFATIADAAEQQARIAVGELSCPSCVYIASNAMKQVPTVKISEFREGENAWEGTFYVTYDDTSATPQMIADAVMGYGYPASVVEEDGS